MGGSQIVLQNFDPDEVVTLKQVASFMRRSVETIRHHAVNEYLARKIGGRWCVSLPAFLAWAEGDRRALAAYHDGDKAGPLMAPYVARAASLKAKGGPFHGG